MKHKHHVIPRHAGGTDDPSNIVEITVEDHAEAHRILWETFGRKEDWIAWQGLSGVIGKDEIIRHLISHKGKNNPSCKPENAKKISEALFGVPKTEAHKLALRKPKSMAGQTAIRLAHSTQEYKRKMSVIGAKQWKVIYPDGTEKFIINMTRFCRENNLLPSEMTTSAKTGSTHHGFRCEKL